MNPQRAEKKAARKAAKKEKWEQNRLNPGNTPKWWKKVRNIAAIVASVTGGLAATIATGGLAAPAAIGSTLTIISIVTGTIAGTAAMTKETSQ